MWMTSARAGAPRIARRNVRRSQADFGAVGTRNPSMGGFYRFGARKEVSWRRRHDRTLSPRRSPMVPRFASRPLAVAATLLVLGLMLSGQASAAIKKHHLGFALGYEKLLSNDLKDDASGIDFTSSGYGSLQYRFSIKQNLDLTL